MEGSKRVVADCRLNPGGKCTLTISGTESEVLDAAAQHVASKHGMKDTPKTREIIRSVLKEEAIARAA